MHKLLQILYTVKDKSMPLMEQGVVSGGNFIIAVLLARVLGIAGYGSYALMWMTVLYFVSLHQSLISTPMQTFMGKITGESAAKKYFTHLFLLQLVLSTLFSLLLTVFFLLFGNQFLEGTANITYFQLGLLLLIYLSYDLIRRYCYIKGHFKRILISSGLNYAIQIGGLLWAWHAGEGLTFILWAFITAMALATCMHCGLIPRTPLNWKRFIVIGRQHLHFSKWLVGSSIIQWLTGNIFLIASGAILGNASVGAIKIAQNIVGVLHIIFLALENYIPSRAAAHFERYGFHSLVSYLRNLGLKTGIAVSGIIMGIIIFAHTILTMVYGQQSQEYTLILQLFAIHYITVFLLIPYRIAIRTIEKNSIIFKANLFSGLAALVLAWPLVNVLGIWGALAGLMATQLFILSIYFFSLKKISHHENYTLTIG